MQLVDHVVVARLCEGSRWIVLRVNERTRFYTRHTCVASSIFAPSLYVTWTTAPSAARLLSKQRACTRTPKFFVQHRSSHPLLSTCCRPFILAVSADSDAAIMSVGGGESNQDAQTSVFQNMVARLMGHAPDVAPVQKRPQASPSTPRSVPAVSSSSRASSTTQSPALLSTQRENTNPPSYLTDRAPSTRSSASNGDLTLTDATTGPPLPSLFGTAEQLAVS